RQGQPVTVTSMTQQFQDFVNNGSFEDFMENDPNGVCVQVLFGTPCPGALNMSGTLGPIFQQLRTLEPNAFPLAQATVTCDPAAAALGTAQDPNCLGQGIYT